MNFRLFIEAEWQKMQRQRLLPFAQNHDNPLRQYAKDFIGRDYEDLDLGNSQYEPEKMYHVTTNLRGVKISQGLKSRLELGNSSVGLGGGPTNMAPNAVSLTYNYGRAVEIYNGLKFVSKIVRNQISASEIYHHIADNGNFNDLYDEDDLTNLDELLVQYGVPKKMIFDGEVEQINSVLDKKIKTPKAKYDFLQRLEKAFLQDNPPEDNAEHMQFDQVIGFTAPFEKIQSLDPANIAILQVLVRKGANLSHYAQEAELRANSKDLVVVRFIQP